MICFLGSHASRKNQKLVWSPRLVYFYLLWTWLHVAPPSSTFDATFCPKTKLWEYQTAQTLKSPVSTKKKKNSVFFPPKQSLAMTKVHYIKWEELQHFFRKYNHIIKRWLCINRKTQVAGKTVRFFSVKRKLFYVYISYTYYILNVWSLGIGSLLKFLRG